MTITAKVRKRMIENGRLVHAIVQGESNATTILFRIEGETDLVAEETLFLYLLYKRPNDQTVQLPILLDYTIEDGVILATFTPGAYFTADAGPVEISVIATSSAAELGGSGEVTNTLLWSSFPAWLLVAPSQLADSSTIIEENVFTQYLAELEALDADAKDYASDAEEYAKGTRSDGGTVTHATDNAKYYKNLAKDWAMKTGGPVEGVEMSAKVYAASSQNYATESQQWANKMDGKVLGTDYSAKYYAGEASDSAYAAGQSAESAAASAQIVEDHAEAIEAIADDLTNIDSVAGKLTEIGTVAGDLANIDAVAGNKTNIDAVNANKTNIDTVAGKTTEITTVAGKANDVTTVAGIASDVTKVAAVDDDVSAVAAIDSDVSAVAAAASDVTAVSGALSDISDVATDLNDDDSAIRAVAADMTGVSAVAADLANIDAVAADLANIDNAEANALKAEGWANGTQNGTPVSSDSPYYENNAKYWADAVPDLKSAIRKDEARITNLEENLDPTGAYKTVNYRGTNDVPTGKAKYALVESIVGKSRAWNQLVNQSTLKSDVVNDVTFTASGNTITVNGTCNNNTQHALINSSRPDAIIGHKYLVAGNRTNLEVGLGDGASATFHTGYMFVEEAQTVNALQLAVIMYKTVSYSGTFTLIIRDLTVIFPDLPSTDLVTSNIPNLVKRCPDLLKYDAFGTSIVDTTYSAVKSVGRNLFDGTWEDNKAISNSTGATYSINGYSITDYIKVDGVSSYYTKVDATDSTASSWVMALYDADKTFIRSLQHQVTANWVNRAVALTGASFVRFMVSSTYKSNVCFNLSDALNGTFTPYLTDTLSLPTSVTLRSAGSVYDQLETNAEIVQEIDGQKVTIYKKRETTRVGTKNLDDIQWSYLDSYGIYQGVLVGAKFVRGTSWGTSNAPYDNAGYVGSADMAEGQYQVLNDGTIWIKDANFESVRASYYLNYALATVSVTLLDPIENNTILTEGGGTINTVQTQTPVIDNSMDVGYLAL